MESNRGPIWVRFRTITKRQLRREVLKLQRNSRNNERRGVTKRDGGSGDGREGVGGKKEKPDSLISWRGSWELRERHEHMFHRKRGKKTLEECLVGTLGKRHLGT